MIRFIVCLMLSLLSLFPLILSATDAEDTYEMYLKNRSSLWSVPENYGQIKGWVCEQIAIDQMRDKYPENDYFILNNINYYDEEDGILFHSGEADLIVVKQKILMFSDSDHEEKPVYQVAEVVEVKCKDDAKQAWQDASDQLQRLRDFVNTPGRATALFVKLGKTDEDDKKIMKPCDPRHCTGSESFLVFHETLYTFMSADHHRFGDLSFRKLNLSVKKLKRLVETIYRYRSEHHP
ncbi:MAG: hypothetical protein H6618_05870 [Deltaproteobacteria bacterium]|nr:hypothetical protein [Deltaproteobacteria bacterium]